MRLVALATPICIHRKWTRWPYRIPRGVIDRKHLVSGLDVLPTLCAWASIDFPAVTGTSLRPLIEEPQKTGGPFVVCQLHSDTENLEMQGRMLRTSHYKYVAFSEGRNPEMFFDLEQDPGETHNLVPIATAAAELDRLPGTAAAVVRTHPGSLRSN